MRKTLYVLTLCLAGCSVGPDYETPVVCLPENYEHAQGETEQIDLASWWTQFDDPFLDSLIEEALSCNYDLRIALQKIEQVRQLYRIDQSEMYPQIQGNFVGIRARRSENLDSDVIETPDSPTELLPDDFSGPLIQNFYQLGFDASWELDVWGKIRRKAEAAYRDFEATQDEALGVQITLLSDVARTYIEIRSLQNRVEAKQEQINRQRELVELAESRYEAGLTSYLDVSKARAALDEVIAQLPSLEELLGQTINGLAVLLGKPPECFSEIVGEKGGIPKAAGIIPINLPSELLCRRPDIRRAERELAAATARIGVAVGELFPSFSLMGSFGTQASQTDQILQWPSRFWSIGPAMTWNLFTGGRLIAQVKVANEIQKQALLTYEKSINEALKDVEDRLIAYLKEEKRLESLEEKLSSNTLFRDLAFSQYEAGLTSLDDVLDAERDLYLSLQEMLESQGTLMINLVGVYKALGGGWECSDMP